MMQLEMSSSHLHGLRATALTTPDLKKVLFLSLLAYFSCKLVNSVRS